jgi:hypothetical protein
MKHVGYVLLLHGACSQASSSGASTTQPVDAQDGGTCRYPASVDVNSSPSSPGCFAHPPGKICQVSNGAVVNVDGSVSNGTESCQSLCGASQYEMTCMDTNAEPDPSLECKVVPIPTPSCCLYYCCACAN